MSFYSLQPHIQLYLFIYATITVDSCKEVTHMSSVDFATIKERVSIVDALSLLGITLKEATNHQLRGPCPICGDENPRSFVVTPSKNLFYCFKGCGGGDQISLVAKVQKLELRDAALFLIGETKSAARPTVPQEQGRSQPSTSGLQPLGYLEYTHDAVTAVGFDHRIAEEFGIGFASKGIMRGLVAVPIRDEDGVLRGYIGIDEARLPKDFQPPENVITFKKKA